jgi:hypothetical protein
MAKVIQKTSPNEREFCTRKELPELLGIGQWTADKLIKRSGAGVLVDGRMIVDVQKIKNYIRSLSDRENSKLLELRCPCGRLLAKTNGWIEIKCPRCNQKNTFDNGKLIGDMND